MHRTQARNTGLSPRQGQGLNGKALFLEVETGQEALIFGSDRRRPKSPSSQSRRISPATAVVHALVGSICFSFGLILGSQHMDQRLTLPQKVSVTCPPIPLNEGERVETQANRYQPPPPIDGKSKESEIQADRFPPQVQEAFVGMTRVARQEFAKRFNSLGLGVPFMEDTKTNREVIIVYADKSALPDDQNVSADATAQTGIPLVSVEDATANCDSINVALVAVKKGLIRRQCLALVGDADGAPYLHRFMRLPSSNNRNDVYPLSPKAPLRLAGSLHSHKGWHGAYPALGPVSKQYREILGKYLQNLDGVLKKLSPIASAAAAGKNMVVVMTSNFGQSEMLVNFVCAARSRGLDLSSVLVFATDEETRDIALGLGLHAFYDEVNFGFIPREAAKKMQDKVFGTVVLAKIFCVHMLAQLGYDVLFQDLDVAWHRSPVEYFQGNNADSDANRTFDIYVQDDGLRSFLYGPKHLNAGFYFTRNNELTRSLLHSYLLSGDDVLAQSNDQVVFNTVVSEYSMLHGLRVRTFDRLEDDFPAGWAYHLRHDYMRAWIAGNVTPYVFHMSWTENKDMKVKYLQQMGDWFVKESCMGKHRSAILGSNDTAGSASRGDLILPCCLAEPDIRCHYKDKPSIRPCADSPSQDRGAPSFWK